MGRKRKSQLMKYRKVALMLLVRDYAYGQRKLRGIIDYYSRHCAWDIYRNETGQPFVERPEELKKWEGDGIIGEAYDENTARMIKDLGIPFVNTASTSLIDPFPSVILDNRLIGKMAAEHLLERELDQFAFVGPQNLWYVQQRFEGFSETISQAGGNCIPLLYDAFKKQTVHLPEDLTDPDYLCAVIKELPLPIGIMASNDRVGFAVLEACRKLGIHSPEDVSLVGVDNDNTFCRLAVPSMTSIDVSAEEIGFTAAQLLDEVMEGRLPKESRILIPPRRLLPRNSTDATRSEFPEVARALRFIRRHDHEFIDVGDVLGVVPVSRRWLEIKFREEVGWGIHHEIRRVHVERAKQLLETTDWSMNRIALECGFSKTQHFDTAFKKLTGMVGRAYRQTKIDNSQR